MGRFFSRRIASFGWPALAAASVVCLVALVSAAPPARSQLVFGPLSSRILELLRPAPGSVIVVAPMLVPGDPTPGPPQMAAGTDVFSKLLEIAGIVPCSTDPMSLRGRPGILELIPRSEVLNQGGKRATMGFFLQAAQGMDADAIMMPEGLTPGGLIRTVPGDPDAAGRFIHIDPGEEYFVLMSYDLVADPDRGFFSCAFEVFLFGPVIRPDPGDTFAAYAPLVDGVAVNPQGFMLQGVPPYLARTTNFIKGAENPLVQSGVHTRDQGCLVCHDVGVESFPQSTFPFPWLGVPEIEGIGLFPWER